MPTSLKQTVVKGAIWLLLEKLSTQLVVFFVTMILARLLTPSDYGTIALLTIFTSIAGVLADSGFGSALVQKKDVTELDFNSVFYISLLMSGTIYAVLYLISPVVADFYEMPELKNILRVIAICLIFNSINSIQNAELRRKLLFHLSFRISLISTFVSAVVGVSLAYNGFGPWALVWSTMSAAVASVVTRWHYIAWRPRWMFSFVALKPLFGYGWKVMVTGLIDTGFNNLYGLLIGKLYSGADLAFVNRGRQFPEVIMNNINGTLGSVAFPALAQIQDDRIKVRETMRRMMVCSTYLVFPLMAFCAVSARSIILVLFGSQWLSAVPYMQLACFTFGLWPFHTINLQGIQSVGRSDIYLKLEILKKSLALAFLMLFISKGVFIYMAVMAFVVGPMGVLINAWPNRSLLNYTLGMQIRDILPTIGLTSLSIVPVLGIDLACHGDGVIMHIVILLFQMISCGGVFFIASVIFRPRPFREYVWIIYPRIEKKSPTFAKLVVKWR